MADLEQTQAIFLDDYEEETDEDISKEKQIVSHLKVLCQKGFPERKFPLYEGDNIIGRQEDACNIAIPLKALSREHACIEIRGDSHLIYDKGSRNKTKRNKLYLTPEVRYELKDSDTLTFGDVTSLYLIGGDLAFPNNQNGSSLLKLADDSDEETGRGRKAAKTTAEVKDSVSDTSQVEVPKGRRGRGRKSEAASTSAIVNNETQIADDECTPPLDNDNEEEEVEDIQTSPPRHGKKRGRSSTSATTTAPVGRGKRAKIEDKKKEDQTSTENNRETIGRRGRKMADKGESVEEDVKTTTAKKGKTRKTPESPKKNEVLEATQPYIDGSTVPEATQIYDMEINDEPEATQAYAMDVPDEDSDTTPPVSDVLGVPVVEGEPIRPVPMDSDEVVPPSHSSEDSNLRSPLVPIPSRSPYKSALASPKKEKKSPSPKRVMFAKRDSEKSVEDSVSTKIVSNKSVEDSNSTKGNVRQSSRAIQKKSAKTDSSSEVNNTTVNSTDDKGLGVTKGRGGRGRKSLPAPTPPNKEIATKTRGRRSALPAVMEVDSSVGSKGDSQEATTSSTSSLSVVDDTGDQTKGKVNRRTRGSTVTEKEEVKKSGKKSSDTTKQDSDKADDASKSNAKTEALETSKVATTGRRGGKKSNITETSVKEESTGNKSNITETSVKETSTENEDEGTTTKRGRGRRKGKVSDSQSTSEETSSQGVSKEETSAKTEPSSKAPPRKGRASSVSSDVNISVVTVKKEGRGKGKKMESESDDSQQSVTSVDSTEGKRGRSQTRKGAAVKESNVHPLPTGKGRGRVSRSSASSQDDSMDAGSDRSMAVKRKRKGEEENSQQSKKTKMEPPATPKTTKTTANIASPSLRRTSLDPSKPKVMFTGVVDEQGQKIVKDLGGELVTSMSDCTHLVTDKVRRTVKFLCCLSRGIPIVTPTWLNSSKSAAMFIDATPFLVKDPATEKQYRFSLQTSIDKARESSLLQGYKIHVTKSVRPEPAQMKDIVLSAGAEFLATIPKKSNDKTVVISCQDDRTVCKPALKAGIPIVNAEFILTGILRQEVDLSSYPLLNSFLMYM
ncbi:hypothetical protein FSP39_004207 [Pinctada imbricata]|uniref:Mediator of DNA damage checkpoint protein 1 n=1 Tax=Pinctada imbricata TaxID=66713 RepID=A0AA88XPY6_PINIB|nr:hypothetical protein FSP39_004207 [Pinctada imbricata]